MVMEEGKGEREERGEMMTKKTEKMEKRNIMKNNVRTKEKEIRRKR
jgi:hypothetical protein